MKDMKPNNQTWEQVFDKEVEKIMQERDQKSNEFKLRGALNKIRRLSTSPRILEIINDVFEETK